MTPEQNTELIHRAEEVQAAIRRTAILAELFRESAGQFKHGLDASNTMIRVVNKLTGFDSALTELEEVFRDLSWEAQVRADIQRQLDEAHNELDKAAFARRLKQYEGV